MRTNVVLNLSGTSNAELPVMTSNYTQCISGNPSFPEADFKPLVTGVDTATKRFQAAMTAPLSESRADEIRISREELERCVQTLANAVETLVNKAGLSEDERLAIVHSAGMQVRSKPVRQQRVFSVTHGDVEGTVNATAAGGAKAHEWQYTSDLVNFDSRIQLATTTLASTQINGLKSGTKYAFFHRPVVVGTTMDWEGPLLFTVQK